MIYDYFQFKVHFSLILVYLAIALGFVAFLGELSNLSSLFWKFGFDFDFV